MIRRLLKLTLAVLLALLLATYLVIGTAAGNRWLLQRLTPWIPGELQIGQWQGSLLTGMQLEDVHYRYQQIQLHLDQGEVNIRLSALSQGWLELEQLRLGNLALELPPPEKTDNAVSLPESLALPFGIRIDEVQLTRFTFNDRHVIQRLEGQQWVAWRRFQLARVRTHTLADAAVSASLQGKLTAPFEMKGELEWQLPLPDNDTLKADQASGSLTVDGPLTRLAVHHALQQPVRIQSQGFWLLKTRQWQLDIQHRWQAQALPLQLPQPLQLGEGSLRTYGPVAQLRLAGSSLLQSNQQQLELLLDGQLLDNGLALQPLTLRNGQQQLAARGKLLFSPLSWDLNLNGQLDSAILHPMLDGTLSIVGDSQGQYQQQRLVLKPSNLTLQGKINDQPLQLNAQTQGNDQQLTLAGQARWGDNQVHAQGQLWPRWQLDSQIQLQELAQLHAQATGSLSGALQLRGTFASPTVSGNLNGQQLGWQDWQLAKLSSRFQALSLGPQTMDLELEIAGLQQGGQTLADRLAVAGNGRWQQHQILLHGDRQGLSLEGQLNGALKNFTQWRGTLQQTHLNHRQLGQWQQAEASVLTLAANQQSLSLFCLVQNGSEICLDGEHSDQHLNANGKLAALPLALANALIGPDLTADGQIDGEFTLHGTTNDPQGHLRIAARDASLAIRSPDAPQQIDLNQLSLESSLQQQQISSTLTLLSGPGQIKAALQHGLGLDTPLTGHVELNLKSIGMIEMFTADLRQVQGRIEGEMDLAGTLRQPLIDGALILQEGSALIPALGVDVQQLRVALQGSPRGKINVQGQARLGDGTLLIAGELDPQQWPIAVRLSFKGEQLLAADRPDGRVVITPDLLLKGNLRALTLTGQVQIPQAEIHPNEIPEGAITVSKDQVLVHAQQEQGQSLALTADITVALGESVHFRGFGLDATLGGTLDVDQKPYQPTQLNGELLIREGRYRAYGQNLAISDGQLIFQGPADNPGLDIRAIRKIPSQAITVGVQLTGTLQEPEAVLFSDPSMEPSQAMSYLLTGQPLNNNSEGDGNRIAKALALYGLEKGSGVTEKLGDRLGVDDISMGSDWETDDASLMLGKQLSDSLYLTYAIGLFDAISTVMLRYTLSRSLHLEARSSTEANSLDLIWEKELR